MEREGWLAWYSARGLATIPVAPLGKRPLRAGWRRADPAAWEGSPADANIGVVCGAASGGLVVLDFDTREGPREASGMRVEELAFHTLVARTARGWHVYARDTSARTSAPWKGLDVRAEGSMVVAPPSVHVSMARYEFLCPDAPIARLGALPFTIEPDATCGPEAVDVDWESLDALMQGQAAKMQAHWGRLRRPQGVFDRSRADFAVARCLWEAGYDEREVARVLLALPGSKARERGEAYAARTAARAAFRHIT